MNDSCNSRLYASYDVNDLFVFDDIFQICLWIINSGCSKHMTGNRALLTNFVENFLGMVRFGNNDFAVIAGYGDGLEVAFRKSTCFVRNEYGVDLLIGDRSSNLYSIALNEIASNSLACLLAKVFFLRSKDEASDVIISFIKKTQVNHQIHVQRVRTDNGTEFKNKTLAKFFNEIHESVNVNFDEISEMASKQFSLEPGLSNLNETGKSLNPMVSQVSETSKKDLEDLFHNFYDEYFDASKITKSLTTNVETSNVEIPLHEEEVFHESSESFQEEYYSSSLNADVQQISTSHNVFNERLEDAYFDANTTFHDPSNVHTFYQPYPHDKNNIDPANVAEALKDADWVSAMQEELDQFARLKVWRLVLDPKARL
ncbi:hypothetical protein Tco_0618619 [Tanacetum coccineum]